MLFSWLALSPSLGIGRRRLTLGPLQDPLRWEHGLDESVTGGARRALDRTLAKSRITAEDAR